MEMTLVADAGRESAPKDSLLCVLVQCLTDRLAIPASGKRIRQGRLRSAAGYYRQARKTHSSVHAVNDTDQNVKPETGLAGA